jgi:hypothetical protein
MITNWLSTTLANGIILMVNDRFCEEEGKENGIKYVYDLPFMIK